MAQRSSIRTAAYRRDDADVHPPYLYLDYKATRLRAPERPLTILPHTLTEVTGPTYGHNKVGPLDHDLTCQHKGEPLGERIVVHGRVLDGDGRPVRDSLIEIWQANRAGRFAHPEDRREHLPLQEGFTGFGRCPTDAEDRFEFLTVKPGAVPGPDGRPQAPHINVAIFARGLLRQLVTRVYFPDEEEANAADPVLSSIEDPNLRSTLIARQLDGAFEFDIHLRGDRENAFFDL